MYICNICMYVNVYNIYVYIYIYICTHTHINSQHCYAFNRFTQLMISSLHRTRFRRDGAKGAPVRGAGRSAEVGGGRGGAGVRE